MYKLFFVLLIVVNSARAGQVYKCTVDGKTTYSQMPCNDEEKQERLYKLEAIQPIPQTITTNTINNPNKAHNSQSTVKVHILNNKIKRCYAEIDKYQNKMRNEIKRIKNKTYYAANNNAGANYLNALSNEMTAVSEKYKVYIDLERDQIKGYREEITFLQSN